MLDLARGRIQPVHATSDAEIDASPLIFRDAAHGVAGQAVSEGVSLETRHIRPRIINATQTTEAAPNPETAGVISVETLDRTLRHTVNGRPIGEAARSIAGQALTQSG